VDPPLISSTVIRLISQMWHGRYQRWTPIETWSRCRVYIDAVHHDWEGFRIWLRHDDPTKGMLIVRFENPLLYDAAGEHDRIGTIEPDQRALEFPHVFWTINESELVAIFHRQSCGIHNDRSVVHYAFLACDQCIDVLSAVEPTFDGDVG